MSTAEVNAQRDQEDAVAGEHRVQMGLHELGEDEVNASNLLNTTKQYNLITKLVSRLGELPKAAAPEKEKYSWNKSVLVSYEVQEAHEESAMGGQQTFKEFRADPWSRKIRARNSQKKDNIH